MTFVKVCGVTTVADALACAEAGVDAIGVNLWPKSKRYRPLDEVRAVGAAVRGRVERFGVFVDPTSDEVAAALESGAIDVAQLHGDEEPDWFAALASRFTGRLVKALRLAGDHSLEAIDRYPSARVLVDAPFAGYGGSGLLVDERLASAAVARAQAAGRSVILAGGLDAQNVAGVIERVRPFGVDVASGVERAPGDKDEAKVRAFVRAVRAAREVRSGEGPFDAAPSPRGAR